MSQEKCRYIEDSAQASGTITPLGPAGSNPFSLATFSFYPTKNLSAMGDAGAILTHSPPNSLRKLRSSEITEAVGMGPLEEIRCDHFQAAVLHHKLSFIEEQNDKRKQVAQLYFKNINHPEVKLLPKELIKTSSWHLFPLKVENNKVAKELCAHLQSHGIGCSDIYYAKINGVEPALDGVQGERELPIVYVAKSFAFQLHLS